MPSYSVLSLLNRIRKDGEIVLPDVQRDFVWTQDQIRQLFDSVMRGYPIGSLLLWQTQFVEVPHREFAIDFVSGQTWQTKVKPIGQRKHMVLDGQQRLQSFLIAIHGSYDGRRLYLNVVSGPGARGDDDTESDYRFEFWQDSDQNRPKRLVRVADIVAWSERHEDDEIDHVIKDLGLDEPSAKRARKNLMLLRRVLSQSDLVQAEHVDEEVTRPEQARSIDEIVEIFVRVNSGGTRLTRTDLMFSLIKSKWSSARDQFERLVREVDPLGIRAIDKDFVIRGLLTVADAPPSYDVENIERHWDAMHASFDRFAAALRAAVAFVQAPDVRVHSATLLKPVASLYPIVYYLSRQKNGSVPDAERAKLRTFLYYLHLSGRGGEARIRYLRDVLKGASGSDLPLDALLGVIAKTQKRHAISTSVEMLHWNRPLTLNIVQPKVAAETVSWQERPEVDHVFPQSAWRPKFGDLVDDIGNLQYLGKLRNTRKNDQAPWDYFAHVPDNELATDFLIDRSLLRADGFEPFVAARREKVLDAVKGFLGR